MEFEEIVKDILEDEKFKKLENIKQHKTTNRYNHSICVAKKVYKIAKKNNMDYINLTRAALLHDYFDTEFDNLLKKIISFFTHSKKALNNSLGKYQLNDVQKNVIRSHMYPFTFVMPKYKESLLVSLVDKEIAVKEILDIFKKH